MLNGVCSVGKADGDLQ